MATIISKDDEPIDAERCEEEIGGKWDEETGRCIVTSDTAAISDGENVAVIPDGRDETVVVEHDKFEDVTEDGDKTNRYAIR